MVQKNQTFDHKQVEEKWRKRWADEQVFVVDTETSKPTFYNLWMFPYPSGEGLHAGHAFASTGSDVYGRFMRMRGHEVFQPIGWDSFGIHSENYAMKIGQHPTEMMKRTTANYARQLQQLGHGFDWTRTVATHEPNYYKWTQWLFVEMFKAGLAYRKKATVNWCPSCKTVLADEQVLKKVVMEKTDFKSKNSTQVDDSGSNLENPELETNDKNAVGVCERCDSVVERKDLEQWFFRITDYADRLLDNLDKIDWPEKIKIAQKNWIGKKTGIEIMYAIENSVERISVFTTRPDTNFGATFVALAPEHPLVNSITTQENKASVDAYVAKVKNTSEQERTAAGKRKTGVFTGAYAINNLNGEKMPIWLSDFVLMGFGTGALVGVPGHDVRDFEFAMEFNLPVKRVVVGPDGDKSEIVTVDQVQEESGTMVNSDFLNGMDIHEATVRIMDYLEEKGWGNRVSTYHLRDWLISRQRYWGPPIPMIYCEACAKAGRGWFGEGQNGRPQGIAPTDKEERVLRGEQGDWDWQGWWPVAEDHLPVMLPELEDYRPKGTGRGPLADHAEFVNTTCPQCGGNARRETDVSDTFLDSAWYFLRYPSVNQRADDHEGAVPRESTEDSKSFDSEITKKWLPVNLYFGGAEHSVLHLMYARFTTQVLCDLGLLTFEEPFPKFFAHGLMIKDGAKMSKSKGNVVNPDEYVEKFGADTLRLYLMFMGPMDGSPDFRDSGIEGMRRWVDKVLRLTESASEIPSSSEQAQVEIHKLIKGVTEDILEFKYNTAIAKLMIFVNWWSDHPEEIGSAQILVLYRLLAPFAPYISEEMYARLLSSGEAWAKSNSVHVTDWPTWDKDKVLSSMIVIPIQVNGRVRGQIEVDVAMDVVGLEKFVREQADFEKWSQNREVKRVVAVPGKVVNIVI